MIKHDNSTLQLLLSFRRKSEQIPCTTRNGIFAWLSKVFVRLWPFGPTQYGDRGCLQVAYIINAIKTRRALSKDVLWITERSCRLSAECDAWREQLALHPSLLATLRRSVSTTSRATNLDILIVSISSSSSIVTGRRQAG